MRAALAVLYHDLLSLQCPVFAQQAAKATLTGTVTDPNGAVVAGVNITATQIATGIRS